MEKQDFSALSQYIAYTVIIVAALIKAIAFSWKYVKVIFSKMSETSTVTVNVNENVNKTHIMQEDCRYFLSYMLEQSKILRALHDLPTDVLKEQMEYFNRHLQNTKVAVTKIMVGLLIDEGIDELDYTTYFSNFENFMEVCEERVKQMFRRMCKDNHFAKYSSLEFKELCSRNTIIIEGLIKEQLRNRYPQRLRINNFSKLNTSQGMIRTGIKASFEHAREVSLDKEQKIKEITDAFEKQMSIVLGAPYSLEI